MANLKLEFKKFDASPSGGLCMFFKMLEKCNFKKVLEECGLPSQDSNRGYNPVQLIYSFFAGVLNGATCFEDLEGVRRDKTLQNILGIKCASGHRAYSRYFKKFTQAYNQRVFNHLFSWLFNSIYMKKFSLDFDSTVEQRSGFQEGAVKGYNPARRGRPSHHPIMAFVPELRMIGNFWLRPGNTAANTNFLSFLENTLECVNEKKVGLIRADSGFFSGKIMDALENREKPIPYIIACRFSQGIKYSLVYQSIWSGITDGLWIAEKMFCSDSWEKERRIVMIRQDKTKRAKAAGKRIKELELFPDVEDLDNYRYSCFVTNMDLPAKPIYDLYKGRADSENRIKEVKYDFALDKFAMHEFWANEACESFIVMAYNLYSLFRILITYGDKHPFLKKMRYDIFSTPGYVKKIDEEYVLYLSDSLNNRKYLMDIWDKLDRIELPFSPQL